MEDNWDKIEKRLKAALQHTETVQLSEEIIMNAIKNAEDKKAAKNPFLGMQAILAGAGAVLLGSTAVLGVAVFSPQQPLVINLSASGGGVANESLAGGVAEDAKMSMWYQPTNFVAGEGLSETTGSAKIYQLASMSSDELLNKLQSAFNLRGQRIVENGDGWINISIGNPGEEGGVDWMSPSIAISGNNSNNGVLYWSYSNPSMYDFAGGGVTESRGEGESVEGSAGSSDTAVSDAGSAEVIAPDERGEYTPSDPTVITAEVETIMNKLGYTSNSYKLYTEGDSVYATFTLDGEDTPIEFYFGFYENQLTYAGGYGVKQSFKDLGEYSLISPKAAVERLNNYLWYASAPSSIYREYYSGFGDGVIAYSEPAVEEATAYETTEEPVVTTASPEVEPVEITEPGMPDEDIVDIMPVPEQMEERTLRITESKSVWVMLWAEDGGIYIVRGYVLMGDDGAFGVVSAVPDDIIKLPEPTEMDLMLKSDDVAE